MQYIKAKFMKQDKPSGRAYTYKTEDDVKPGDIVMDAKGSKLVVVDEPMDTEWIRLYGADKIATLKKYEEPTGAESEGQ